MPANLLILCRPLPLLPSIFPSIRVFSNESVLCIRWPKYWSFSFSISPSNEYPGLLSFRMDWLDLLAVQGTLKSLLQHHSSKASILRCSTFFIVQHVHPYMTTGKWTFVWKVMSLLFNMLSRLVITFLPKSTSLLISWLQSPSAVILEPKKNKVCHYFHCFPIYLPWSDGTDAMIAVFCMLSFKPTFSLSSFTCIKRLFSFLLSAIRVVLCRTTQDGWVMVESSDKTWSTGEGNGKPRQYSCLENPTNSMKRQKDRTLKDELPNLVGP